MPADSPDQPVLEDILVQDGLQCLSLRLYSLESVRLLQEHLKTSPLFYGLSSFTSAILLLRWRRLLTCSAIFDSNRRAVDARSILLGGQLHLAEVDLRHCESHRRKVEG